MNIIYIFPLSLLLFLIAKLLNIYSENHALYLPPKESHLLIDTRFGYSMVWYTEININDDKSKTKGLYKKQTKVPIWEIKNNVCHE